MLNDGVGCTDDVCDEVNDAVLHVPDDSVCDDGLFCNGSEVCDEVDDCQAGDPPDPDDGVTCTVDTCDESTDDFVHTPDDSACDDTLSCNGDETCDPVDDCQPGTPIPTDDGIDCTIDMCDETNGAVHIPDDSFCDDGDFCNGAETCDPTAGCQPGTPPSPPDDGVDCTVAVCNETNDDFDHVPDDAACEDGDLCNGAETCDPANGCQPGTPPVIDDGVDCTVDSCDPSTGVSNTPDDSQCDNGLFCDGAEYCDSNTGCEDGTPPTVDDGEPCTTDACDEGNDEVTHDPLTDGTTCNTSDICVDGTCGPSVCGDSYVDSSTGEECDDGNTTPGDGCDENCKTEVVACDVNDTWTISGASSYSCLGGLLDIDVSSAQFFSDGAFVVGSPGRYFYSSGANHVALNMTGSTTTCPSGSFTVSQTFTGGCDETYTLSGTFTGADTWSGTFTIGFSGDCVDCASQSYNVTGTR